MRLIAFALAAVAAAAVAPPAHGATRHWKISGALSGHYSIEYSISRTGAGCSDRVSESATNVRVAVRSRRLVYDTRERSILSIQPLSLSFNAGKVTFSGTITPAGDEGCGAPQPYACTGKVRGESGARANGRLNVFPGRRVFVGGIEDSTLVQVRGGAGGPPESPCEEMADPVGTRGDFGPEANDVLAGLLRVPSRKLAGRRAFTVVARAHRDEACDRFKMSCVERSTLRLALTFSPA